MPEEDIEQLVVLPRRVVHQPTPELHPGGDCGACVLAGLTDLPLEEVYAKLDPKHSSPTSFWRGSMIAAVHIAKWDLKRITKYIEEVPYWPPHEGMRAFGDSGWMQSSEWFSYVTMAFEAGYYAIASVVIKKTGPFSGGTDHWVLLCGSRLRWGPWENGGRTGHYEVLVSCSARSTPDEEWVGVGDFLRERGGFDVILVRPV